jgi:hypothetical protein
VLVIPDAGRAAGPPEEPPRARARELSTIHLAERQQAAWNDAVPHGAGDDLPPAA